MRVVCDRCGTPYEGRSRTLRRCPPCRQPLIDGRTGTVTKHFDRALTAYRAEVRRYEVAIACTEDPRSRRRLNQRKAQWEERIHDLRTTYAVLEASR